MSKSLEKFLKREIGGWTLVSLKRCLFISNGNRGIGDTNTIGLFRIKAINNA